MSNVGNEKPTPSKKKRKSNKKEELLQEQERFELEFSHFLIYQICFLIS